jgi:DMSO/TMAO reductase YedYZ molybdopterin-dependent catalytic subunit
MERRSFLALLGLGAASSGSVAKSALVESAPIVPTPVAVATTQVTVPSYMVRMPVTVSLTPEQIEAAEISNMSVLQYAQELLKAKQRNEIEGEVDSRLEYDVERVLSHELTPIKKVIG